MKCEGCGDEFKKVRSDQRFCGATCRFKFANNKRVTRVSGITRVNTDKRKTEITRVIPDTDKLKDEKIAELERKIRDIENEMRDKNRELEDKYNRLYNIFMDNVNIQNDNFSLISDRILKLQNNCV
jgi:seryl-tRNA synthetase